MLITFAISLVVLLGFTALATEAGRWYLVRSELSKAVDAAALSGAKNISNPFVTVDTLARQVGNENFPAGQLGTPAAGQGSVSFTVTMPSNNKVQVVGNVSAIAFFSAAIWNSAGCNRKHWGGANEQSGDYDGPGSVRVYGRETRG